MKIEMYEAVIKALSSIQEVKHIDLWNRNVEFVEEDEAFPMPAVFVEFGDILWSQSSGSSSVRHYRGKGTVILHVVTEWHGSSSSANVERSEVLRHYDLCETIHPAIEGLSGEGFQDLQLQSSMTGHDHEEIQENIEVYAATFFRTVAGK